MPRVRETARDRAMMICSPHCGADPSSSSGGEVYERNLLAALGNAGDEIHLILARHKETPPGIRMRHPPAIQRGLRWWVTPFVWPRAIARCWHDCGPFDLLRAHSARFAGPACLIARSRLRLPVPVVTHLHHLDPSPLNWIERRGLLASDLVITDSDFARTQLTDRLRIPDTQIRVIHSGISEHYRPRPGANVVPGLDGVRVRLLQIVLLAMGHLIHRKGPLFAVEAVRALRARGYGDKVKLVWIGDGPLRRAVERASEGLDVLWIRRVSEAEKLDWLQRADIFLHPASIEGFPLAPQEAMAMGRPVVARRQASMAEMVDHGETGLVADSLTEYVCAIETLIIDGQKRLRMGRTAAREADQRFRFRQTADAVRATYWEAIERTRTTSA